MRRKWLRVDRGSGLIERAEAAIKDETSELLRAVATAERPVDEAAVSELRKRKLVVEATRKVYSLTRTPACRRHRVAEANDLTAAMLAGDAWAAATWKRYNLAAKGAPLAVGSLHPLMKVRAEFRTILLGMGFEEMPTNNYVESSFWNFDALFQPQQHPARDAHDTFFLTQPRSCNTLPEDYAPQVHRVHEQGGYGSLGYRYPWSEAEARKNLLRTHTTAVSARMLRALAQRQPFAPARYFSIDRVFRNEAVDATHLAEFHQVEGLVADRNLTLSDLIGTIQTFFRRIGIEDVRFKPAYNPYTEPSMEIFGFSRQLNRWIEVGNSGVFRPEMLRPMGLPEDVSVIAWGLSLERPTMIKYGIRSIRDLFGPRVKLDIIAANPVLRYDK
jgi:phenylalanyl-tRNA synthetase alpha chain